MDNASEISMHNSSVIEHAEAKGPMKGREMAEHREDAPPMTWLCACGDVEFEISLLNSISMCHCCDCVNRARIGQKKNGYDPRYNNFWCGYGGWAQGNAFTKNLTITKGSDKIKGFRAGVKNAGTELNLHDEVECCKGGATANGGDKSITVYASCCGTIMYQLMRCLLTMPSLPILALLLVTALMHVNN